MVDQPYFEDHESIAKFINLITTITYQRTRVHVHNHA